MRQTNGQEKDPSENQIRNLIERAVKIKDAGLSSELSIKAAKSPHQIMCKPMAEALYELLNPEQEQLKDWGAELTSLKLFMHELLVLMGKPNVVNQLPEYMQNEASKRLGRLEEFFNTIDKPETNALMDWESLDYPTERKSIEQLHYYYRFDLEEINQPICNNYLLGDYSFEEKRLGEMNKFERQLD